MVSDKEDIRQSLLILFSTKPGERIIAPDYGCNFRPYAFEIADTQFYNEIKQTIRIAIEKFEKRIEVQEIDFIETEDPLGQNIEVVINYRIKKTGENYTDSLPVRFE